MAKSGVDILVLTGTYLRLLFIPSVLINLLQVLGYVTHNIEAEVEPSAQLKMPWHN